jgi:hypothetical protein
MTFDVDKRVGQFVALRDKIKEMERAHEEALAPYKEAKDVLGKMLLAHLNSTKSESVRTTNGTCYKTEKRSASIQDKEAFWDYVVSRQAWDLIDKRANANAVKDWADEKGEMPPGLNYSSYSDIGVRRA